jgi:hypothetical protein
LVFLVFVDFKNKNSSKMSFVVNKSWLVQAGLAGQLWQFLPPFFNQPR